MSTWHTLSFTITAINGLLIVVVVLLLVVLIKVISFSATTVLLLLRSVAPFVLVLFSISLCIYCSSITSLVCLLVFLLSLLSLILLLFTAVVLRGTVIFSYMSYSRISFASVALSPV